MLSFKKKKLISSEKTCGLTGSVIWLCSRERNGLHDNKCITNELIQLQSIVSRNIRHKVIPRAPRDTVAIFISNSNECKNHVLILLCTQLQWKRILSDSRTPCLSNGALWTGVCWRTQLFLRTRCPDNDTSYRVVSNARVICLPVQLQLLTTIEVFIVTRPV